VATTGVYRRLLSPVRRRVLRLTYTGNGHAFEQLGTAVSVASYRDGEAPVTRSLSICRASKTSPNKLLFSPISLEPSVIVELPLRRWGGVNAIVPARDGNRGLANRHAG